MELLIIFLCLSGICAWLFLFYLVGYFLADKWSEEHREDNHVDTNLGKKL